VSGRDTSYPLPELQQWDAAVVDNWVWGDPTAIDGYARAMDTAGGALTAVADGLARIDVSAFWKGDAANAFTSLRDGVAPAVHGLAAMHKDGAAALGTWQRSLAVYREDCAAAITTGKQGYQLYRTTSCDNEDAQAKMRNGRTGIGNAAGARDGGARTCTTAMDAATAKADVPTQPPAMPAQPTDRRGPTTTFTRPFPQTGPTQVGTAPSGREPVPMIGPIAPGRERPYLDPANGRLVVPAQGPYLPGRRPWTYPDGRP
jgi:hypothetical protein